MPLRGTPMCELAVCTVVWYVTNYVALVRERTIPTERPPLVGEVSASFCGYRSAIFIPLGSILLRMY
jgi:hypothetical protein